MTQAPTNWRIGYCTNVHAGADFETMRANLERYALAVKRQVSPDAPMGVGLWLSATAARKLLAEGQAAEFAAWLAEVGLLPFTLNGFPQGDFHQPVVKHRVYQPTWFEASRLEYTLDLIEILDAILPAGVEGSISTLPLAWGQPAASAEQLASAAGQLRRVAQRLARLEQESGRLVHLGLEPEPGCVLERSEDVVRFYESHLLSGDDQRAMRRHIRVCHDICHAAVMREGQRDVIERYAGAGIGVGKVQVSSAVCLPLGRIPPEQRGAALEQLASFAEDRYLHQTTIQAAPGATPQFYEDLPAALATVAGPREQSSEWRVHFHVPIYLEAFGLLATTRDAIFDCLRAVKDHSNTTHFEVETYAWGVLPHQLQQPDLATGIARELQWFQQQTTVAPACSG